MTRLEALARRLCKAEGDNPDAVVAYQTLSSGLRVRCEQPRRGAPLWDELPNWQWANAGQARDILERLGVDPTESLPEVSAAPGQGRRDDARLPLIVHDLANAGGALQSWELTDIGYQQSEIDAAAAQGAVVIEGPGPEDTVRLVPSSPFATVARPAPSHHRCAADQVAGAAGPA